MSVAKTPLPRPPPEYRGRENESATIRPAAPTMCRKSHGVTSLVLAALPAGWSHQSAASVMVAAAGTPAPAGLPGDPAEAERRGPGTCSRRGSREQQRWEKCCLEFMTGEMGLEIRTTQYGPRAQPLATACGYERAGSILDSHRRKPAGGFPDSGMPRPATNYSNAPVLRSRCRPSCHRSAPEAAPSPPPPPKSEPPPLESEEETESEPLAGGIGGGPKSAPPPEELVSGEAAAGVGGRGGVAAAGGLE